MKSRFGDHCVSSATESKYFESSWFELKSAAMNKYRSKTSVIFRNFCFLPPSSSSVHTLKLTSIFTPTRKHVYS